MNLKKKIYKDQAYSQSLLTCPPLQQFFNITTNSNAYKGQAGDINERCTSHMIGQGGDFGDLERAFLHYMQPLFCSIHERPSGNAGLFFQIISYFKNSGKFRLVCEIT